MRYFLILIHNHQPVGNFKEVIINAFYKSYIPFLEKVLRYKNLKISLHTSGNLFEFMEEENIKDYEDLIRELIKENRLEIFSGTFYEAILPLIPEEDKIYQIKLMNDYIIKKFNYNPKGMWLTERVWEMDLPKYINKAGIEYTLIDDNAFKKLGLNDDDLTSYFITENEGYTLKVFPILKKLRYLIPFKDIGELIEYINKFNKENLIFTYGDDGEKFGLWPNTYEYVYKDGYLDKFLSFLNNEEIVKTLTFKEIVQNIPPKDRIYLNTSSYEEMEEWSNGNFRNFLSKYNESNKMHKRMLFMREFSFIKDENVYRKLLKSQCNDAYWHGIFGGLYLPHLREAIYKEIIEGENLKRTFNGIKIFDFDKDGLDEIAIIKDKFKIFLHRRGGKAIEIDYLNYNLTNVMTRYKEIYHDKLLKEYNLKNDEGIKTIHESFRVKDSDIKNYLIFDRYFKENFLIHIINDERDLKDSIPLDEILNYKVENDEIYFYNEKIKITYKNESSIYYKLESKNIKNILVIEFNFYIYEDFYEIFDKEIVLKKDDKKIYVKSENIDKILTEKIYTISSSESGIEKIYQGTTFYFFFKLKDGINIINIEIGERNEK
jgi:alpha-amylase